MKPIERTLHIDGLRSIALFGVLLYHCQIPHVLQGGFLGVDVFFVISGYVITASILRSLHAKRFTFLSFIRKRIKRLIPTLASVIIFSNFTVIFLFTKEDIKDVAFLSISSLFSISNVQLWLQSNYFDSESYFKPYLHTWSLSLEWQFYISWALFLYFLHQAQFSFNRKLSFISLLGCISVALAQTTLEHHQSCAFYNLPFRYSEFIIGAMPAFLQIPIMQNCQSQARNILSYASFTFLLLQFFFFDSSFDFPGINALPLCTSTVVLILSLQKTHLNHLLSCESMVWIGQKSYSIYLVHWPMLVFFNYVTNNRSTVNARLIVLFLSIVLGIILNYCIEIPFQQQEWSSRKKLLFFSAVFIILLQFIFMTGYQVKASKSNNTSIEIILMNSILLRNARNSEARCFGDILCHASELYSFPKNFELCNPFKSKQILLVGDSHAADFWYILNSTYWQMNVSTIQMTGSACNKDGFLRNTRKKHCDALFSNMEKFLEKRVGKMKVAIICVQWDSRLSNGTLDELKGKVDFLRNRMHVDSIIIIGPRPEYSVKPLHVLEMIAHKSATDIKNVNFTKYCNTKVETDNVLQTFSENHNVSYVSVMNKLCPRSSSHCRVNTHNEDSLLYFDSHHFNREGARVVFQELKSFVDQALGLNGSSKLKKAEQKS